MSKWKPYRYLNYQRPEAHADIKAVVDQRDEALDLLEECLGAMNEFDRIYSRGLPYRVDVFLDKHRVKPQAQFRISQDASLATFSVTINGILDRLEKLEAQK